MITFLVPTFNERKNIYIFINTINRLDLKLDHNILFIDDNSNDGTIEELIRAKKEFYNIDYIIRNEKKRDLTQSLVLGINYLKEKYTLIMDCDLQHDYEKIEILIKNITENNFDLVIGSRFIKDGQNISMNKRRVLESKLGILLSRFIGINTVMDPLSGFFIIRTNLLKKIKNKIKTRGFKILLTILYLYKNQLNYNELPIKFNVRIHEKSKLNFRVKILFLEQLLRLKINY